MHHNWYWRVRESLRMFAWGNEFGNSPSGWIGSHLEGGILNFSLWYRVWGETKNNRKWPPWSYWTCGIFFWDSRLPERDLSWKMMSRISCISRARINSFPRSVDGLWNSSASMRRVQAPSFDVRRSHWSIHPRLPGCTGMVYRNHFVPPVGALWLPDEEVRRSYAALFRSIWRRFVPRVLDMNFRNPQPFSKEWREVRLVWNRRCSAKWAAFQKNGRSSLPNRSGLSRMVWTKRVMNWLEKSRRWASVLHRRTSRIQLTHGPPSSLLQNRMCQEVSMFSSKRGQLPILLCLQGNFCGSCSADFHNWVYCVTYWDGFSILHRVITVLVKNTRFACGTCFFITGNKRGAGYWSADDAGGDDRMWHPFI